MCRCSQKQWVVSLQVSLAAVVVQPLPAYSSGGQVKISVKFFFHHMKKKPCNCSEWPDWTDGKTAFYPLLCWMADCVTVTPFRHPYPHNPCDSYNLPQFVALSYCLFITEISFLWRIVTVGILMSLLSIQCIAVQSPMVLTPVSHCLSFTVLHLKSFDVPSMFSPTVPKQLIFLFFKSLTSYGKEKKLSMYNLCPLLSVLLFVPVPGAVSCTVCPFPNRLPCHMCNHLSHKVCKFWCQNTFVNWEYTVWKPPFLWTTQSFQQLPDFLRGCKILKIPV